MGGIFTELFESLTDNEQNSFDWILSRIKELPTAEDVRKLCDDADGKIDTIIRLCSEFSAAYKDVNAIIKNELEKLTAADVGARPDTWTPTAAEVGARPDTWTPTAAEVGASPSGYVNFAGAVNTFDEFMALINNTFDAIGNNKEYRLFCSVGVSDGAIPAGSWFVSIKREWEGYGVVEIVNDSYKFERRLYAGTWGDWRRSDAAAFDDVLNTLLGVSV